MYQAFILAMLLVYSSNNIEATLGGHGRATLATVLLVSLYRTPLNRSCLEVFYLCIVGIALALFNGLCLFLSKKHFH